MVTSSPPGMANSKASQSSGLYLHREGFGTRHPRWAQSHLARETPTLHGMVSSEPSQHGELQALSSELD